MTVQEEDDGEPLDLDFTDIKELFPTDCMGFRYR